MPMPAKTMANWTSPPLTFACLMIWAASLLWGSPLPENMGNFCPRIRVFMPSMAEMPVCMKSLG